MMAFTFHVAPSLFLSTGHKGIRRNRNRCSFDGLVGSSGCCHSQGVTDWTSGADTRKSARNFATFKTADCLSGAHIKRKLKSIFQHMVMHFLLADEASIPAPIASIAKIPFFFNSLLIGIHSCSLALALLELLQSLHVAVESMSVVSSELGVGSLEGRVSGSLGLLDTAWE